MLNCVKKINCVGLCLLTSIVIGCHPDGDHSESILPEFMTSLVDNPREIASNHLASPDPDLRAKAIAYFSVKPYGNEELYLKVYREMVDYADSSVRIEAVKALGTHGNVQDAQIYIAPRLKDEHPVVRWQAAVALGKIHNPKVISDLMDALQNDKSGDVKMACARSLGQYPSRLVFGVLVQAIDEQAYRISFEAVAALQTITGQDIGDDAEAWLKWSQNETGDIFRNKKKYTYKTFKGKKGLLNNMMIWKKAEFNKPKNPTGVK